ncbi:MAG: TrmH family RNA methyltransferase [Verrucomicrobiota bacterium]
MQNKQHTNITFPASPPPITSHRNPRIKHLRRLRERRYRDACGDFLIEGTREISRACASDYPIHAIYYCPDFLSSGDSASVSLLETIRNKEYPVFEVTSDVFRKVAYRDKPEGLLATAKQTKKTLSQVMLAEHPLIVVAAGLEKPGNLGTILRSADATGVAAVIVCENATDIFNPNVVRGSTGTLFTVPVVEATPEDALAWLREKEITTIATLPDAEANYTAIDMTHPTALIVGSEADGLDDFWQRHAELAVTIPMFGCADSLNVTNSLTVILYEALRQRGLS